MLYELAIIGGGPAGASASVYAARKKIKTILITPDFGGQSIVSPNIQNWTGNISISGTDLAENFKKHVEAYKSDVLEIKEGEKVLSIKKSGENFSIETDGKNVYEAKAILVVTGSGRRKLEVPGADKFEHKGLTYCATCDGPMFSDQDVVVIGGGNAGFESAAQLLAYSKSVTIIHHSPDFKADKITVEKVLNNPKAKTITSAETVEVKGDDFVKSLVYKDLKTGENHEINTTGIFVEIGQIANTDFVKDLVILDAYGKIIVDPKTQTASVPGIWAAGDCSDGIYHQNMIAAGDAIKALENIYIYLHNK
ncbi:MAG: FAD-dependent oxidoreductase [Candidatus Paceibacterota bacterium]|jgi:alkyl hydroperoxide reductase subunit F